MSKAGSGKTAEPMDGPCYIHLLGHVRTVRMTLFLRVSWMDGSAKWESSTLTKLGREDPFSHVLPDFSKMPVA